MKRSFLETERLVLRYMAQDDFTELKSILQDKDVMYAWEYEFSDFEVQNWIDKNLALYKSCNLGYFIVEDRFSGKILGQSALMPDFIDGKKYYEIGYIFKKEFWHNGFAFECAGALAKYAFENLDLSEVIFEIRPSSRASCKVAERLGAKIDGDFVKQVRGKNMLHLIYKLCR